VQVQSTRELGRAWAREHTVTEMSVPRCASAHQTMLAPGEVPLVTLIGEFPEQRESSIVILSRTVAIVWACNSKVSIQWRV